VVLVVGGVILFTDTHSLWQRFLGGGVHAVAHLAAVFFVGVGASRLVAPCHLPVALELLAIGALVFAAGWITGSLVLGGYLFVSLNAFGRHNTEAFSSLAIADWKNFLRIHIDEQGAVRIYPIGIDRVPRRWQASPTGPRLVSCDPQATAPRLIEPPIVIPDRAASPPARRL
jgi:hypothetical protein